MAALFFNQTAQYFTADGTKPLSGGQVFTYETGTTTLKDTFSDLALTITNTNPLILDTQGKFQVQVFAADAAVFSIEVKDSADVVIDATVDNISFVAAFSLSSADVIAALAANSAQVDLAGSSIIGTAFGSFADNLDLTAAGSIDASAGAINLGTVTGPTVFSDNVVASGAIIYGAPGELTIASGAVTVTQVRHKIDTENNDPTDDLDTINGVTDGFLLILQAAESSKTVVLKDSTGNLALAGNFTMDNARDKLTLVYDTGTGFWTEMTRSSNAS